MLRLRRPFLLLALLGLVLGLAAAIPAGAQTIVGPFTPTVTATGAGPTLAAATEAALDQIREDYIILSYTTSEARCSVIPTTGDPFCSIKVTARVIRKSPLFP
ncbi:MAG TPA: hypothetical protein VJ725_01555 [Thermoanaerobaculia bacterium]|nr:hypothetical protein [Thermoanaerobaculia bacterium]